MRSSGVLNKPEQTQRPWIGLVRFALISLFSLMFLVGAYLVALPEIQGLTIERSMVNQMATINNPGKMIKDYISFNWWVIIYLSIIALYGWKVGIISEILDHFKSKKIITDNEKQKGDQ